MVAPRTDAKPTHGPRATRSPAHPPDPPSLGVVVPRVICPYLLSDDGTWLATKPMLEHRCTAVRPAEPVSGET